MRDAETSQRAMPSPRSLSTKRAWKQSYGVAISNAKQHSRRFFQAQTSGDLLKCVPQGTEAPKSIVEAPKHDVVTHEMKWWGWAGLLPLTTVMLYAMWSTVHYRWPLDDPRHLSVVLMFLLVSWMLWWGSFQK